MTTNYKARRPDDQREFTYNFSSRWVTHITQAIIVGVTSVLTSAITVVVTILLLLGGLWLAYVILPINVFYIILAVLIADIALGIVLRSVFSRR